MIFPVACRVTPENFCAILSEAGKEDLGGLDGLGAWLEHFESGYFVRDEQSAFDCHLIEESVFHELYAFAPSHSLNAIFYPVTQRG